MRKCQSQAVTVTRAGEATQEKKSRGDPWIIMLSSSLESELRNGSKIAYKISHRGSQASEADLTQHHIYITDMNLREFSRIFESFGFFLLQLDTSIINQPASKIF